MSDVDALLENKELHDMLEFETQIFLDIIHNDAIVVAAKGLSMDAILINLLKVYCDPGNLVIVLNCTEFEEKYYIEKLKDENVHTTTFSTNTIERQDVYLSGGIHFVTTRILVVDMLKKRIPIEKITGFIVLRAHSILESCQEAFVLRLYRQHNKTGFIKAFTNNAQNFTFGFGHIERVMRTIFVKELYIWPRFHSMVIHSLKKHEPKVIELHIPISEKMGKIQTCILDLMNLTVKELKRINKTLEMQEITVENCLTKKFHKILQSQLDCIWYQLSQKSKQLITELKTLRHLIVLLFYSDSITFYTNLQTYRTMEYAQSSFWVLLQPAEILFTTAATLVFTGDRELNPELCPKWNCLLEVLKVEIPNEIKKMEICENKVLILCQDPKTCFQLNQFLMHGPQHYLFLMALKRGLKFKSVNKRFEKCEDLRETFTQQQKDQDPNTSKLSKKTKLESEDGKKKEEVDPIFLDADEVEELKDSYFLTMTQTRLSDTIESDGGVEEDALGDITFEPFPDMENFNLTQLLDSTKNNVTQPSILIQTFKSADNFLSLQKTLEEVQPDFIIMYHTNVTAVRQIELYEARRKKDKSLKVYFLLHAETVEEQSYLTSLRREKEAFEFLIETKKTMVVPEDQDGKSDQCLALQRELKQQETNTRQGGVTKEPDQQVIIVDMREFRSELPALIHKRGIEIEPLTITVGDYILNADICVERKSLSDLVGSLNSGRLYQQCTQMSRYYAKPMLLIEFDQNKPFSWQSNYMVSNDENSFEIQQKLLLLTLHFPKLKIIWSPSPYASAQLFEELKFGKEQPNIQYASAIGSEQDLDVIETKYNTGIYDFVQKLPGITSKNIDPFLRKYKNLDEVLKQSEEQLTEVLGNTSDAHALYSILHEETQAAPAQEQSKGKSRLKSKFKYTRNKK